MFLQSWYKFYCVLARSRYKVDRSREFIPGYKVGWRALAQCRGTSYLEARNLSRCRIFIGGQVRVSGCNRHYKFVLSAGAKAKTVTNNLPILSVLGLDFFIIVLSGLGI